MTPDELIEATLYRGRRWNGDKCYHPWSFVWEPGMHGYICRQRHHVYKLVFGREGESIQIDRLVYNKGWGIIEPAKIKANHIRFDDGTTFHFYLKRGR